MIKHRVLFVGSRNGSRCLMAEAFVNALRGEEFEAESAGFTAGEIDPVVIEVMAEVGIDISRETTKTVFELYRAGRKFHSIVTICDRENKEKPPIFPGHRQYVDWDMCDPDLCAETPEKFATMRSCRDRIREKVINWMDAQKDFHARVLEVGIK